MFGRHPLDAAAETDARPSGTAVAGRKLSRSDRTNQQPGKLLIGGRHAINQPDVKYAHGHITRRTGQCRRLTAVVELERSRWRERDVDDAPIADRGVDGHGGWTGDPVAGLSSNIATEAEADEGHNIGGACG